MKRITIIIVALITINLIPINADAGIFNKEVTIWGQTVRVNRITNRVTHEWDSVEKKWIPLAKDNWYQDLYNMKLESDRMPPEDLNGAKGMVIYWKDRQQQSDITVDKKNIK